MATITDFKEWLNEAEPDGFQEIYDLYKATSNIEECGIYECFMKNGQYFIKGDHTKNILMLASGKEYSAFLEAMNLHFTFDGDIESWYGLKLATAKSD